MNLKFMNVYKETRENMFYLTLLENYKKTIFTQEKSYDFWQSK